MIHQAYCEYCGTSFDEQGQPRCEHQVRDVAIEPRQGQQGTLLAGAARFVLHDYELAQLLHLPAGVHIHHCFVPSADWGACIGFIVYENEPGILPAYQKNQEIPVIHTGGMETVKTADGRFVTLYNPIPEKK